MKDDKITKIDFIEILQKKVGYIIKNKNKANEIFNTIIEIFQRALSSNYTIELRGFGTFSIKTILEHKRAWKLKYDKCVQRKTIPESKSVIFKPSKTLLKIINEKEPQNVNKKNEVKNASKPTKTDLNILKNSIKEEINLISEEAKRIPKNDIFN
jgi:nucleoid DNA-binding protein